MKPFWEEAYADLEHDTFGAPAAEVVELAGRLGAGARALDAGCGDGRHSLVLARHGLEVDAFDVSERGVAKLRERARREDLELNVRVADVREMALDGGYDLVVCHGMLHLLERDEWARALPRLQAATRVGGWNVVTVFTDRLAPPRDIAPFMRGLFHEGELETYYAGWDVSRSEAYTLEDDHPGGIHHRHAVNKVVARRLSAHTEPHSPYARGAA